MIADAPRPFIFVHIPKTAGTSIEKALMRVATGMTDFNQLTPELANNLALPGSSGRMQHARLSDFIKAGLSAGRYVFTVVRNPYARALSEAHFLRQHRLHSFRGSTWKEDILELASMNCSVDGHDLSASQVDYISDLKGEVQCDRVIRFETLEQGMREVWRDLGVSIPPALGREFDSRLVQPWWEFYDAESAAAIADKHGRDFKVFGYSTEIASYAQNGLL